MSKYLTIILSILLSLSASGQSGEIDVPFIIRKPVIDGKPDKSLDHITWSVFPVVEKSDSANPDEVIRYKLGYGTTFLYLIIEMQSGRIIHRDRAYQNGDGIHLVIARPKNGGETDEFFVLRFSPEDIEHQRPARKAVWYYNVGLQSKNLSSECKFVCASYGNKSWFELLIPFDDIYPYNPLFSDSIGLNVCFVKAVGEKEKNFYLIKRDDRIQSEQSRRKYMIARFCRIADGAEKKLNVYLPSRNIKIGEPLPAEIHIAHGRRKMVSIKYSITSPSERIAGSWKSPVIPQGNVTKISAYFPLIVFTPGNYRLKWHYNHSSSGEITFTVLPDMSPGRDSLRIEKLKEYIKPGDYFSLCFLQKSLRKDMSNIKKYELADKILEESNSFTGLLKRIETDPGYLSRRAGEFRRAFLSGIDGSLQPYTIRIPPDFDTSKRYPLFVMLHGSGSDDTDILDIKYTADKFIEIAPFGRGTSNCFTTDNAEKDVKEAIEDVISNYPIDTSRILIAGFSMGGYGAYRIFYEYPKMFRGVAVFSGHPSLASKWLGEGYPDFLKDEYVRPFKNIPVFIYHCMDDMNCPYDLTKSLVEKLERTGAKVRFLGIPAGGHGVIGAGSMPVFLDWLKDVMNLP